MAPLDREFGLEPKQHVTEGAREKLALMGATDSYAEAALKLDRVAGLPACAKEIQRITVAEGRRAAALLKVHEEEARRSAPEPREEHDTVVLEMDGTCVLTQPPGPRKKKMKSRSMPKQEKERRGKEIKCATAFGLDQRVMPPERPMLAGRRYIASMRGIEEFAAPLFALLVASGGMKARRVAIVGDGAPWIWKWVKDWLRTWGDSGTEIIEIVDFWHAAERLSGLSKKLFGEGTEAAREWFDTWRHQLKHGKIDGLLKEMEKLRRNWKSGKKRKACDDQLRYFCEHRERMRYDRFAAQGLPIGSGAIEGTCKCLVKKRMATSGMHWGEEQIEPIVALRTVLFNNDWDQLYAEAA